METGDVPWVIITLIGVAGLWIFIKGVRIVVDAVGKGIDSCDSVRSITVSEIESITVVGEDDESVIEGGISTLDVATDDEVVFAIFVSFRGRFILIVVLDIGVCKKEREGVADEVDNKLVDDIRAVFGREITGVVEWGTVNPPASNFRRRLASVGFLDPVR